MSDALPVWRAAGLDAERRVQVGSTNDEARGLAHAGAAHGTWVVTEQQTAGRGRLGRRWEAPDGSALFLSVLLRPELPPTQVPLLCLGAAERVAALHPDLRIKWPNDVLLPDGRKVSGILAEAEMEGQDRMSVVLGVGVNLTSAPPLATAGCMAELGGWRWTREEVAVAVVEGVLDACRRLEAGDASGLVADWSARCGMLGAQVRVSVGRGVVEGVATRVDETGTLWVDVEGSEQPVRAGDVDVVRWQ